MREITHLTNDLQKELNKIGSFVLLETETNSVVKLNYKDWAYAKMNNRTVQVSTFVGNDDKHLQLEEKYIVAATSSTSDISEMAKIIDDWLAKEVDISQLIKEHLSIKVSETYQNLKTLSNKEILENRWESLLERIKHGKISFRRDLFEKLKENFSNLFPFFSHDNLYFSNILELSNDDFKSPFIFCDNDLIWVGFFRNNSEAERNKTFKTSNIQEAILMTQKLLPGKIEVTNPLTI